MVSVATKKGKSVGLKRSAASFVSPLSGGRRCNSSNLVSAPHALRRHPTSRRMRCLGFGLLGCVAFVAILGAINLYASVNVGGGNSSSGGGTAGDIATLVRGVARARAGGIADGEGEERAFAFSARLEGGARSLPEAAYDLALAETRANVANGTAFIAGAGWTQLWTRDTSYAIELGAGLVHPDVARASLEACTEDDPGGLGSVWLQDRCDHFGGWPNLSDAIVGARGAWAHYVVSGNETFLAWAYDVTRNSLARAERDAYDVGSGLFTGCSSFMESNSGYPQRYSSRGDLVGRTKALSTNALYHNGYTLCATMGIELGLDPSSSEAVIELNTKAARLRESIRSKLWLPTRGYYAYFLDENDWPVAQMEGLGESLLLLSPDLETDGARIDTIFAKIHRTEHGLPCLWPRFDLPKATDTDIAGYYHNGRIWPFVQGYWATAAARHGRVEAFADEFDGLLRLSQPSERATTSSAARGTFAEFYELDGSFPAERSRQLWSDAAFLGMVFHGLFGMHFVPEGIEFRPAKPPQHGGNDVSDTSITARRSLPETISLERVRYRNMTLNLYVSGYGSHMHAFKLDGRRQNRAFVRCDLRGDHKVEIFLRGGADTAG